jgi:hypothetical protein
MLIIHEVRSPNSEVSIKTIRTGLLFRLPLSDFRLPVNKAQPGGLSALEAALADVENCDL